LNKGRKENNSESTKPSIPLYSKKDFYNPHLSNHNDLEIDEIVSTNNKVHLPELKLNNDNISNLDDSIAFDYMEKKRNLIKHLNKKTLNSFNRSKIDISSIKIKNNCSNNDSKPNNINNISNSNIQINHSSSNINFNISQCNSINSNLGNSNNPHNVPLPNKKMYCPFCQHCNSTSDEKLDEYLNILGEASNFFNKLTEAIMDSDIVKSKAPEPTFKSLNFVENVIDVRDSVK